MTSDPIRQTTRPLRLVHRSHRGARTGAPFDFQLIVEQSLSLVVLTDAEGCIEYVNPRFCEVTGYASKEVVGRRIHELGELPLEQAADIWKTVSAGDPWRGEFLATKKNGGTFWVYSCISPVSSESGAVTHYLAVNLDISERKLAEIALSERDSYYRALLEDGADVIAVLDVNGSIRYVSPSVSRILGYDPEALLGSRAFDLLHPEDVEDAINSFARSLAYVNGPGATFRDRVRHADGSWRTVESAVRSLPDGTGIVVSLRDISDGVATEQELRRSESRFRAVVESIYDVVSAVDASGTIVYQSPSVERVLGYTVEERVGASTFDFVHPDDQEAARRAFSELIATDGDVEELRLRAKHKDGSWRVLESVARSRTNADGEFRVIVISRDITDRVQAEDAIRERDERFRAIVETSQEMIWEIDVSGRAVYFNPAVKEVLGYEPTQLIGQAMRPLVHEEDWVEYGRIVVEAVTARKGWTGVLSRWQHANGGWRYLESNAVPLLDADGAVVGFRGSARDVTERLESEAALRQSEASKKALLDALPDLLFRQDREGRYLEFVPGRFEPAIPPGVFLGKLMRDVLPAEVSEPAMAAFERVLDTGSPETMEYELTVAGERRAFEARIVPCGPGEVLSLVREVTDRRRMEEALRASEDRLRTLLYNAPVVLFAWDRDGYFIACEGKGLEALSRAPGEVVGRHITELNPAGSRVHNAFQRALSGEVVDDEVEVGDRWWAASCGPLTDATGVPIGVIAVGMDVTDRRTAEAALRASEERLRTLLFNAPIVLFAWDKEGYFIASEGRGLEPLGRRSGEVVGQHITELYPVGSPIYENFQKALAGDLVVDDVEVGGRWFTASSTPLRDAHGAITGVTGVAIDITARREAEQALRESQEQLRLALDHAQMTSWEWDIANDALSDSVGEGGPLSGDGGPINYQEFIGRVHPDDREAVAAAVRRVLDKDDDFDAEFRMSWPDGTLRWVVSSGILTADESGKPQRLTGVAMDITRRKEAEEALRGSEERLRYLLYNSPIVLSAWDTEGRYVLFEGKALETIGVAPGALVGRTLAEVFPNVPDLKEGFERALQGKIDISETRVGDRWWTASSLPLQDSAGETIGVIGISVDITERKRAESALRRSEERYRALYQDNPSMYFTVAEDGTVLSVNQFGAAQLGYTPEELAGRSVFEVFHKPDRAAVRRQLAALAAGPGEVRNWEFRKVRKDGQVIWVKETVRAVRDADQKLTFLVVCEDISERKRMETAMQAMREQLERRAERAVARGNVYGLSFRELTVLDQVADGKSDKEIAILLGIRPMTVSKHVANVLKKMHAASRAEAGVRALRDGLIR